MGMPNVKSRPWKSNLIRRSSYEGIRYTEQVDSRNRPLAPLETSFTIENAGRFQPLQGDMQLTIPENIREKDVRWFTTTTDVKTVQAFTTELADRVIYKGVTYVMLSVKDWDAVLEHYEVMVVREFT